MSRRSEARKMEGIGENGLDIVCDKAKEKFGDLLVKQFTEFEATPDDIQDFIDSEGVATVIGVDLAVEGGDCSATMIIEDSTPEVETEQNSVRMVVIESYAKLKSLRKVAADLDMTYQQVRTIINEHNAGLKESASS